MSSNSSGSRPGGSRPYAPRGSSSAAGPSTVRSVPSTSRNANLEPGSGYNNQPRGTKRKATNDDPNAPLPRDKSLGQYIEFDLSKVRNTKGGFLVEDEDAPGGKAAKTVEELRKERERQMQRLEQDQEPGIILDSSRQPRCHVCNSMEVDDQFRRIFSILVCKKCTKADPDRFSLLTKTEVKEDYLLTDSELRDPDLLPHLLRPNPHKATYSNMMLFLRCQVEAYAFGPKRWGSAEALDAEFARRQDAKAKRRGKKFAEDMRALRKRTRDETILKRNQEASHEHDWVDVPGQIGKQECEACGQIIEVEEF
ncbi:DNA repair protein rad14 [Tilletia horrida]|uniref:DNA repair protein RAD14 n=1 Tax=Tilletia horrida TaxID=155126 RepID=A0AAN6JQ49_9BASI|nr:DNA repair protein rad14 [Tilletia horrida]KAK0546523.1 DNA repair protein rad14 [Tilletia horrida]KAK0562310.1 DNA repair protein rad14 [Tilletia horrida]